MRARIHLVLAATLFMAPVVLRADTAEIDDHFISARKNALETVMMKRSEEMNKEASEMQTLDSKLKSEHMAFERKAISDRRAFLDELKKMDVKKRKSAFDSFNSKEDRSRHSFLADQRARRYDLMKEQDKRRKEYREEILGEKKMAAVEKPKTTMPATAVKPKTTPAAAPAPTTTKTSRDF